MGSPQTLVIARLIGELERKSLPDELTAVKEAIKLACKVHETQLRDDGAPYVLHPLRVAYMLVHEFGIRDIDTICAGLLHDAVEDGESISLDQIERNFGMPIAAMIGSLTKPPKNDRTHAEINAEYFPRIRQSNAQVRIIKLADRLDNIRDLPNSPNEAKRRRMLEETKKFYLPLINSLEDRKLGAMFAGAYARAIKEIQHE